MHKPENMAVYVDDMYKYEIGEFQGMKMSHMIADTKQELLAMVDKIGVQRKWIQKEGTFLEHFDISITKRELAVKHGAVEITYPACGRACQLRRITGKLGLTKTTLF